MLVGEEAHEGGHGGFEPFGDDGGGVEDRLAEEFLIGSGGDSLTSVPRWRHER